MKLTSREKVTKVVRKTNAQLFSLVSAEDILYFELEITHVGSNRGRSYAPNIKIIHEKSETVTYCSLNQLSNNLSAFELSPL
jgi:hypothetical protein